MNNRKLYFDCLKSQQVKHRRMLKEIFKQHLEILHSLGLKYKEIILEEITPENSRDIDNFSLNVFKIDGNVNKIITPEETLVEKDKILMSDKHYHQFKQNLNLTSLPTLSAVKKKEKKSRREIYF